MHLQFQRRRTWLWAPGRSSLSADGRTAGEKNRQTSVSNNSERTLMFFWPNSGSDFRALWGLNSPRRRWRSRGRSRACQWSGRSSAARPGRDAWCSSSARCAQPWCAYAGWNKLKLIRHFYITKQWESGLRCDVWKDKDIKEHLKGLTSFFFMMIFFWSTLTA